MTLESLAAQFKKGWMDFMKTMTKRILALCMALILVAGFGTSASAKVQGYYFKNAGVSVTMDSAAKNFISKAGKPLKTEVKKSCAYKGKDRTYQYKNFILKTYSNSDKGAEYIQSIIFLNKKVSTKEGIKIGSKESLVTKKYGKATPKFGVYTYTKGNTKLQFEIEDGTVKNVRYTANK